MSNRGADSPVFYRNTNHLASKIHQPAIAMLSVYHVEVPSHILFPP